MTTNQPPPSDSGTTTEAAPPHNVAAEQALLGSLLTNNRLLDRVPDRLAAEHFYSELHGQIFEVIRQRVKGGDAASPTLLVPYFKSDDAMQEVGGVGYLARLTEAVASFTHVPDYADAILVTAHERGLMES